jgi:protein-arginine kinase activator protein McsA
MICTWCEKSADELFPVPGKDGSAQMVCPSCANRARGVARWAVFLASARMPADGHCECGAALSKISEQGGFRCEKCGRTHRLADDVSAVGFLLN